MKRSSQTALNTTRSCTRDDSAVWLVFLRTRPCTKLRKTNQDQTWFTVTAWMHFGVLLIPNAVGAREVSWILATPGRAVGVYIATNTALPTENNDHNISDPWAETTPSCAPPNGISPSQIGEPTLTTSGFPVEAATRREVSPRVSAT